MDALFNRLPRVPNCCFCCKVSTGALVIGYLELILGVLAIPIVFYIVFYLIAQISALKDDDGDTDGRWMHIFLYIYIFDLIIQCCFIVVSLLLLMGVYKKNTRYIFVWMTVTVIFIFLLLLRGILVICFGMVSTFIGCLFYIAINVYFLIVVNTFYQGLKAGDPVN